MNHKIIAYNDKVEVWLHMDEVYSSFKDDYLKSDDDNFIARLTLYRKDLLRLVHVVALARKGHAHWEDDAWPDPLGSVIYDMPGHIVSAAHLADPDNIQEGYMTELFTFDPMHNKLVVFNAGGIWLQLRTNYDDSFVKIGMNDVVDELRELKDKLGWNNNKR